MPISTWRAGLPRRAADRGNRMALPLRRTFLVTEFVKIRSASVLFRILANSATVLKLLLIAVALFVGCRQANQLVVPPPPKVTVAQPVERQVNDTIEFVGTTQATQSVELRSQVKGYLERILFEDGSNVKAGDLLFVIEQAPYKLALDSAKAALQKRIASQALAESQYR